MRTHYSPVADNPCESRVVYMEELSRERIEQIYNGEGLPPTTDEIRALSGMALSSNTHNHVSTSRELTAKQIRAIQLNTEIGGYITAKWSGSYDLLQELWEVAVAASD